MVVVEPLLCFPIWHMDDDDGGGGKKRRYYCSAYIEEHCWTDGLMDLLLLKCTNQEPVTILMASAEEKYNYPI